LDYAHIELCLRDRRQAICALSRVRDHLPFVRASLTLTLDEKCSHADVSAYLTLQSLQTTTASRACVTILKTIHAWKRCLISVGNNFACPQRFKMHPDWRRWIYDPYHAYGFCLLGIGMQLCLLPPNLYSIILECNVHRLTSTLS
jgi:hypothetical protein